MRPIQRSRSTVNVHISPEAPIAQSERSKEHNVVGKLTRGYALRMLLTLRSRSLLFLLVLACLVAAATVMRVRPRHAAGEQSKVNALHAEAHSHLNTVVAQPQVTSHRFAVYIDAGSSGTRVHVFRYHLAPWPEYVEVELPDASMRTEPGISHFADEPQAAADSLKPLLDFAYAQIPEHHQHSTPVRLLATAGLRLVTEAQRDAVLGACRSLLASSHFAFRYDWAKVIPGDMEGVYAWTGANYAAGLLQASQGEHKCSGKIVPFASIKRIIVVT